MTGDRLAVVVLTWNQCDYTVACLRSLAAQTTPHTVYVVDNASTDGTPDAVRAAFPDAHMIVNRENLGFAGGNNVGLRRAFDAGADAVLLLNNDTTLAPDALALLCEAAHAQPDAGILNPAILYAQPPHRVWFAGATADPRTGWSNHVPHNVAYESLGAAIRPVSRATGCAMLVTRACYARVGDFDDDFFMYFEDVEYSLRARRAGFGLYVAPRAVVYHHVSASSSGTKPANATYYGVRNGIVTFDRHYPRPWPATLLRHFFTVGAMIYYLLKPPTAPGRILDALSGYRDARRKMLGPRGAKHLPTVANAPFPMPQRAGKRGG